MTTEFDRFDLHPELLQAVMELGYEEPTPIQTGAIPALLAGRDVMGQAQTGTGKTAAFALPMLHALEKNYPGVQGLVVVPTRELAIQVARAIYDYGKHRHVHILPVYGGQAYGRQINRLERGVDIVVGTPGRMLDLMRKGVLDLSGVRFLVLDEADEMLSMGFIEDIEAILRETPEARQTALFSATLPEPIRRLADRYMRAPEQITIDRKHITVAATEQRYYMVNESDKLAAITRLLEVEAVTSALIFTCTKVRTSELADALFARGFQAEALHGDLGQPARETVMGRFRHGKITVLVATDVAARGLDIDDVSHVINYDIPFDPEVYVHRIGRTGRAGKTGVAITLVAPQERRKLQHIEAFTMQPIIRAELPGAEDVLAHRDAQFLLQMNDRLANGKPAREKALVDRLLKAGYDPAEVAAAAIQLARAAEQQRPIEEIGEIRERSERRGRRQDLQERPAKRSRRKDKLEAGMVRFSMNVGKVHGIRPGDVVGAIASEAGIPGRAIGAIEIQGQQTFVDVSEQHAERVLHKMGRCRMRGQSVVIKPAN